MSNESTEDIESANNITVNNSKRNSKLFEMNSDELKELI
jgi:hypothetical protein